MIVDNLIILSIKVENGKITVRDGMGHEYTMTVEYGDFGKSSKNDEWVLLFYFYQIPFKGDVYNDIQEKTGVKNYNFRLNMIYMDWMGEGFREMVSQLH